MATTDAPDPVVARQAITYTVKVTNAGPAVASEVTLTDEVVSGLFGAELVSVAPSQGICTSRVATGGTIRVSCALGAIGVSESARLVVVVHATSSVGETLENMAHAVSTTSDQDLANNTANTTTQVLARGRTLTIVQDTVPDGPEDAFFGIDGVGLINIPGPQPEFGFCALDDDAEETLANACSLGPFSSTATLEIWYPKTTPSGLELTRINCSSGPSSSVTYGVHVHVRFGGNDAVRCVFTYVRVSAA